MTVFDDWGLTPIINVSGTVTRLGGAPMPPAVLEAFRDVAQESIPLEQLHATASRFIAQITNAEAGLVTSGAAAGLLLGAAAMMTGWDLRRMEQLPCTADFPHEFVIAREQRNGYDHAVRAAGGRLIEVGFHELAAGAGVRRAEAWEYEAAFSPRTAGVLYVLDDDARPPLREVVTVAHHHELPVLVDAAGALPPRTNLHALIDAGADLVVFSGGKAIRGPQSTGILCGRRDLIAAAAVQMLDMDEHWELWEPPADFIDKSKLPGMPRHGIGRALKVSKEEILALLTALRLLVAGEFDREIPAMEHWLRTIAAELTGYGVRSEFTASSDGESYPRLELLVDEARLGRTAFEVCRRLRRGNPPVYVGHARLAHSRLVIHPLHLTEARTRELLQRLREELVG